MVTSPRVPFNEYLHIAGSITDGASAQTGEFHVQWRPEYANSSGSYHGGALMAMADAAMSKAVQLRLAPDQRMATVQMSSSFISAGAGDVIISVSVVKAGRKIAHCTASIATSAGKLLLNVTGVFAITTGAQSPGNETKG